MFEARLIQGSVLKKMIDAIKDIVTDINLDCSSTGNLLITNDHQVLSLSLSLQVLVYKQWTPVTSVWFSLS